MGMGRSARWRGDVPRLGAVPMHSETLPLALSLGSVGNCEEKQPRLVAVEEELHNLAILPALSGTNRAL